LPDYLTDGMVLFGAHDDDRRVHYLKEQGIPFVLIGHQEGVRWVSPDDFDGGLKATRHLLKLGHKDIVHMTGAMQGQGEYDRFSGYKTALETAGLELRRDYLLDGEFTSLGAYRSLRKAYESGLSFSAVFAASDEMALGVMVALKDSGLKVPMDVSVVGFDDLPDIGAALTTIRQDIRKIAATAVSLLKDGLEQKPIEHQIIPVELIVRGTTAKRR
jgi:LacI family transcriptional regulator